MSILCDCVFLPPSSKRYFVRLLPRNAPSTYCRFLEEVAKELSRTQKNIKIYKSILDFIRSWFLDLAVRLYRVSHFRVFCRVSRLWVEIQRCGFHITLLLFYETKDATYRYVLALLLPKIQGESEIIAFFDPLCIITYRKGENGLPYSFSRRMQWRNYFFVGICLFLNWLKLICFFKYDILYIILFSLLRAF